MRRDAALLSKLRRPLLPLIPVVLLGGCFFDQVQHSEEADIQRVEQKQAVLQSEQDNSTRLDRQKQQLAQDLSERQISLDELNTRVEEINAENGASIAQNESARARYRDLLMRVHETSQQIAMARQGGAGDLQERRDHIASLEAQLKTQIDLLYSSETK